MFAQFIKDLQLHDAYELRNEAYHHMIKVSRLKRKDHVLLLDGNGLKVFCELEDFDKKSVFLKRIRSLYEERTYQMDLLIGMPKKEALELSLKQATELGFENIILVRSDFSQNKGIDSERVEKLLISAIQQSNAPFLPTVNHKRLSEVNFSQYSRLLLLNSQGEKFELSSKVKQLRQLLIIGPEGGFSEQEIDFFNKQPRLESLKLPTPILRTPTAVATGAGILIHHLLN